MNRINVDELAEYLNVHRSTVYRLISKERLPAKKVHGRWQFDSRKLEQWLNGKSNIRGQGHRRTDLRAGRHPRPSGLTQSSWRRERLSRSKISARRYRYRSRRRSYGMTAMM